jgi:hypothetical protein
MLDGSHAGGLAAARSGESSPTGPPRARWRGTLAHTMEMQTGDLDWALVRARAGDEAGFLALWRSLHPRLLRYLRVVGCDDPDDVASETWLQVVRGWLCIAGSER